MANERENQDRDRDKDQDDCCWFPFARAPAACNSRRRRRGRPCARSCEEIELKCYSLSPDRLLINSDRRCQLAGALGARLSARPLAGLADGRRHLDVRRPECMSLITFKIHAPGGQIERRLSIHEIAEDDDFLDCRRASTSRLEQPAGQPTPVAVAAGERDCDSERRLKVAQRLASRSFLLVERAESDDRAPEQAEGGLEASQETRAQQASSLERELISSISIERPLGERAELASEPSEASEPQDDARRLLARSQKRPKRARLNLARRLFRLISSSSSSSGGSSPASPPDANHWQRTSAAAALEGRAEWNLGEFERPESIYLWPPAAGARDAAAPIMISYNHVEGRAHAVALHAQLEQLGARVYLDLYDIGKGQDWQDSLNFAILSCRLFVALVTPSYGETLWTSRECKLADVLGKRIIPINFGQRWPPPALAIQFATLQYVDWLHAAPEGARQVGASWPRECVAAIAQQLARSAALECAPAELDWATHVGRAAHVSKPPSPHLSDSGYEEAAGGSGCLQSAAAAAAGQRRLHAALSVSLQSNQNARNQQLRVCLTAAAAGAHQQASYGATEGAQTRSGSQSDEPSSADAAGQPELTHGFRLERTRGARNAAVERPAGALTSVADATAAKPAPARKRRSLGQRAKRALGRVRRSLASSPAAHAQLSAAHNKAYA